MDYLKKTTKCIKPKIIKGVTNTLQGYAFGCMLGMFVGTDKITLKNIHNSGKNIAKVCAVYSTTEIVMETIRGKNDLYTRIASGAVSGGLCSKGNLFSKSTLGGSLGLGFYSGLTK